MDPSIVARRGLFVLLTGGLLLAGCSGVQTVVLPASDQPDDVQRTTRQGYDFLESQKEQSRVVLSMRTATPRYAKFYVTVENTGTNSVSLPLSSLSVETRTRNGGTESFQPYSPDEVPGVVIEDINNSYDFLSTFGAVQSLSQNPSRGGRGSVQEAQEQYGGGSESRAASYKESMLETQSLSPQNVTSGLVYTPFNTQTQQVTVSVPVGGETHTFRYDLRKTDS